MQRPELSALTAMIAGLSPCVASGQTRVASRRAVPAHVISADVAEAALGGAVVLGYEGALTPYVSLFVEPRWQFRPSLLHTHSDEDSTLTLGVGATAGARLYLRGFAPMGLFFEVHATLQWQWWTPLSPWGLASPGPATEHTGLAFWPGVMFGYQWVFARAVAVAIGAGVEVVCVKRFAPGEGEMQAQGVAFPLRAAVGWTP